MQENWNFYIKQCPFTRNFAKQPYICFVPKVLRIIFTPINTPPKLRNLKMSLKVIFLGHPVPSEKKNLFPLFMDFQCPLETLFSRGSIHY